MVEMKEVQPGLELPAAEASSKEVLELKPNKAEDATEGPHAQVSPTMYVTWKKPDGTEFIAPLSNSEVYERKGYTAGKATDIPDLVAHNAELAAKAPAKEEAKPAAKATTTTTTEKSNG